MGISTSFDLSRITNLEDRTSSNEVNIANANDGLANKLDLTKTTSQTVVGQTIYTAATNGLQMSLNPATNGQWFSIWNPIAGRYSLALGRFATASEALELRAYWDKFTIRTGRSAGALNADVNIVTNDAHTAGISSNINLSPDTTTGGVTNINSNLFIIPPQANTVKLGFRFDASVNAGINWADLIKLKFMSDGSSLMVRTADDTAYKPIYASAFNVGSETDYKEDIKDYTEKALEHVKGTKVRTYKVKKNEELGQEIGLIREDAPEGIQQNDSISLYGMVSMLWKAVQELSEQVESLKQ